MPAVRLRPLNMNRSPVRCPPLLRRSLGLEVAGCVSRETQPLWSSRRPCLRVRITFAETAIPAKAAWFVSYGILPDGLRKNRTRRIPSRRSRFVVLSSTRVGDLHLPSLRAHSAIKLKPEKPSPVVNLRRIRSFHCAHRVQRSSRPHLAFRIIPPFTSPPSCALVSLSTSALDISSNHTGALPSRPCRLQRGASRCFT